MNEWRVGMKSIACCEREIKDLKQQRDNLLAACEMMISSFKKSSSVPTSLNSAYEIMKQAIKKAK